MPDTITRRHLSLLLGVAALLYLPSLFGQFVFDDHYLIEQNAALHSAQGLRSAFTEDYYGQANPQYALGYYRPLSLLTHWLDWQIWGLRPFGHHLTSLLLHLACVAALYLALLALFDSAPLALLASMFFAAHPSHAGSVTFVSGRVDVLAALLSLLSLLAFCRKRALAAPAYFAALLSKEMSVTLPALAFWKEKEKGWRSALLAMIPFVAVLAAVAALRYAVLGPPAPGRFEVTPDSLLDAARAVPAYLRFLVLPPFQLYLEPSPARLPLAPQITAAVIFAAGWWLLKDRKPAWWSVVWMITLLPVLGIAKIETSLDERFLYFPSVSVCILAGGWALQYLRRRNHGNEPSEKQLLVTAVLIAALLAPSLFVRQAYWLNDLALWNSAAATDTSSSRVRLRLGVALMEAGQPVDAERQFREALALPQEGSIYTAALYTHLATAMQMQGNNAGVEELYRKSLALQPNYFTAHFNLGLYYKMAGRNTEAIAEFQAALRANPRSDAARQNLGELESNHQPR